MLAKKTTNPPANSNKTSAAGQIAEAKLIEYHRTGDVRLRNDVVQRYLAKVYKIASQHPAKAHIPCDELASYGCDGLLRAAEKWRADRGVSFGHFATQKIRFAIADGLRSMRQCTRTQAERGEAKTFGRLSALGREGAREHQDFAEFERCDEYEATVGRAVLSWPERVMLALAFREGWDAAEIAEAFDCEESDVKQILKAVQARLGDGAEEVAPKVYSLRHRSKKALEAAEREFLAVMADVEKFAAARMQKTVVKLLKGVWQRRVREDYSWTAGFVRKVAEAAQRRGVGLLPMGV